MDHTRFSGEIAQVRVASKVRGSFIFVKCPINKTHQLLGKAQSCRLQNRGKLSVITRFRKKLTQAEPCWLSSTNYLRPSERLHHQLRRWWRAEAAFSD